MSAPRFLRPRRDVGAGIGLVAGGYTALALWLGSRGAHLIQGFFGPSPSRLSVPGMTALLSAVASGMIAFTGVVFSLAFVGLQFGSSTYGPRIYGALGGGRRLGHAVGIFTGTFVFALMALRTIDVTGTPTVPHAIAWLSLAWLLASVGVAARLLPQVTRMSIGRVLADVGALGLQAVARVYRQSSDATAPSGRGSVGEASVPLRPVRRTIAHHGAPSHLLGFDLPRLVEEARRARGWVEIPHAIGDPIEPGQPLAIVHGRGGGTVSERRIRRALWLGVERTTTNDPAYALRLLVDTAIRALSPAINDPTTASDALVRIHAILLALGRARLDIGRITDSRSRLRLVFRAPTWDDLVNLALCEIAFYGRESSQVRARLKALEQDLRISLDPSRLPALVRAIDLRPRLSARA